MRYILISNTPLRLDVLSVSKVSMRNLLPFTSVAFRFGVLSVFKVFMCNLSSLPGFSVQSLFVILMENLLITLYSLVCYLFLMFS